MSQREKVLLIALAAGLFAVVSLFGFKLLVEKRQQVAKDIEQLRTDIDLAEYRKEQRELDVANMEWFAQNEPEPREAALAGSQLQDFITTQANANRLEIKAPQILPNDASGVYYEKASFQLRVTGMESDLYRWLSNLHNPEDFRAVTRLVLFPNKEDDSMIDATVIVTEWFIPATEEDLQEQPTNNP